MKLASYRHNGEHRIGAVVGDDLIDLRAAALARWGSVPDGWPRDMIELIEAGEGALQRASEIAAWAVGSGERALLTPIGRVVWDPPVRRPSKICCLALNNSANKDRIISGPRHPAIFVKASNALVGHAEAIMLKPHYGRVHPEPELAVVIGRTATDVSPAAALDHVFGYTIHNDITSPTMRGEDTFHYRAIHPTEGSNEIRYVDSYVTYPGRYKGSDTFSPLGPWIVTRDEIDDPHALAVVCQHRNEVVTEDNTANLFHRVPDVIAFVSGYMTLLPGDVVSMGTALKRAEAGGRAVQNVDLQKLGGPVSVTIEKIGTLSNPVERRAARE
jgi:2-keto-4-pentenoate hydratase/2-oxohepta-3-ene-1,7-dioic acid hydratase in catechol pathway